MEEIETLINNYRVFNIWLERCQDIYKIFHLMLEDSYELGYGIGSVWWRGNVDSGKPASSPGSPS